MRSTVKTIGIPAAVAVALGFAIAEPGHSQNIDNAAHLLGAAPAQNGYKAPTAIEQVALKGQ